MAGGVVVVWQGNGRGGGVILSCENGYKSCQLTALRKQTTPTWSSGLGHRDPQRAKSPNSELLINLSRGWEAEEASEICRHCLLTSHHYRGGGSAAGSLQGECCGSVCRRVCTRTHTREHIHSIMTSTENSSAILPIRGVAAIR